MIHESQAGQRAEQRFYEGYNCCESVVTVTLEAMGVRCDCLPGLATGMGGGIGRTGHVCGAVSGGAMALGLAATRMGLKDHAAEKAWANDAVGELIEAFDREFTFHECRDLIGIDLREPDCAERYRNGGCKEKCGRFVRFVAEWVVRRLAGEGL